MREFLSGLFAVSLTMGAVTALLLILSPVWKRRFRPQWRCWAWLLVALRLAVPFNVSLPRAPVVLEAPAPAAVAKVNPSVEAADSIAQAVEKALAMAGKEDAIIIFGSLSFLGEAADALN